MDVAETGMDRDLDAGILLFEGARRCLVKRGRAAAINDELSFLLRLLVKLLHALRVCGAGNSRGASKNRREAAKRMGHRYFPHTHEYLVD